MPIDNEPRDGVTKSTRLLLTGGGVEYIVDNYLDEYFSVMDSEIKIILKNTWKYGISSYSPWYLKWAFNDNQIGFQGPSDIRALYIDVWKALFPEESLEIRDEAIVDISGSGTPIWDAAHSDISRLIVRHTKN
jgi:hypothetical protein